VPLRVLLVEDSEDDALLLMRELRRGGHEPLCERVDTAAEMEAALDERVWDLVIADHSMPAFSSSAALELLKSKGFVDLPFIIVSGQIGEDAAVAAMRAGAHDYIMKGNLARLNTAIERELREAESRRERRRAEEKYRTIFENAVEGIFQTTVEGRFVTANPALARMLGYDSPEELLEHVSNIAEQLYVEPERRAEFGRLVRRDGFVRGFEIRAYRRDGDVMWASLSARAIRDVGGEVIAYEGTVEDITERKRTEEALRQSEELYRTVVEQAAENIFLVDVATRHVLESNPTFYGSLGYSPEEIRHLTLYDIVAHDRESIDSNIERVVAEGHRFIGERRYRRKDDSLIEVEVGASAISYEGREAMCVVAHDVTERKRAERALREIREAERRRIARELHDIVLQDLTYALQSLQVVRRMPEANREEETGRQVEALKRAVEGLRDAIYELRLESAREHPLVRTLSSIVELSRQMAPECAFELIVDEQFPASLSGPAGLEVARIVQEALANVRRHSGAGRATVTLGTAGEEAWVEVEDDGRGLDPEGPPGMGLTGMRERALALGGQLEVEGERDTGTRVRLRMALSGLVDEDPEYSNARP
jgi:PAS domain S-box-containing protein